MHLFSVTSWIYNQLQNCLSQIITYFVFIIYISKHFTAVAVHHMVVFISETIKPNAMIITEA